MNKLIASLVMILSLSGCMYQQADITDIKKAQQQCEGRGGIKYILISFSGNEIVYCVNGFKQHLGDVVLREYENG